MTTFVRGRPVETAQPMVLVDAGLAVGTHRFQLVVVSNDGRRSAPQLVDVVITQRPVTRPPVTPVVTPVVRPVVTPVVTPVVRPVRAAAEARKSGAAKPTRPAKRS